MLTFSEAEKYFTTLVTGGAAGISGPVGRLEVELKQLLHTYVP